MKNIWTILHQLTEYWIRLDSLIVGGKKLLGFKTNQVFSDPICAALASHVYCMDCTLCLRNAYATEVYWGTICTFGLRTGYTRKTNQSSSISTQPTKEVIRQNPDRLVERKRNQKRREQKSEQKRKPNCTVNSKSSRIPSPSPSAYSQNQKDYDRRLETTVQLSIIIKHLKLKVRPGFVFFW